MPDADGAIDLSSLAEGEGVRDGESITKEDLEALMAQQGASAGPPQEAPADLVAACAGGLKVNSIPATIELDNGRKFIADDFRAWGYCPYGVFAIGYFEDGEQEEEYRVFNGDKVNNILLNWAAFEEEVRSQQAAAEEAAKSEEEPSGDDAAESSSD